ncbi:hypothetical protein TrCOL_g2048 [Triparma columacea]|uniref:Mannosyltransferase n=1 Tax=Triparma columacea TaxID=722753 RepID=A0A9W7GM16_9STRA|nr:hypothetical protein TrCOL_g2048 [Triparma columacea]
MTSTNKTLTLCRYGIRSSMLVEYVGPFNMSISPSAHVTASQTGDLILSLLNKAKVEGDGKKKKNRKIAIFSSPFLRACQTAHGIYKVLSPHFSLPPILVEPGITEWLDPSLVSTSNLQPDVKGEEYDGIPIDEDYEPHGDAKFPETVPELSTRLISTVTSLLNSYDDVIIVSHAPCLLSIARHYAPPSNPLNESALGGVYRFELVSPDKQEAVMTHNSYTLHLTEDLKPGIQRWDFPPPSCSYLLHISYPFIYLVTFLLLLPSILSPISDCDEVYNYYEPLKIGLLGEPAMMTWENSKEYAFRTYAMIEPSKLVLGATKIVAGIVGGEVLTGDIALILTTFTTSHHLNGSHTKAILTGMVATTCIAWPFVGILYVPLALDALYLGYKNCGFKGASKPITVALASFVALTGVTAIVDKVNYGVWTIPNLNIFIYNAIKGPEGMEGKTGDELYGVEPFGYYVKNLILNFGPAAIFIPLLPLVAILKRTIVRFTTPELTLLKVLTPLYIWIMVVGTRPHKEERFLYPVYHLIPIAAATTLWMGREICNINRLERIIPVKNSLYKLVWAAVAIAGVVTGWGRSYAIYKNYNAPIPLYTSLSRTLGPGTVVCTGNEWYRFPSSFFLGSQSLRFLKSGFGGQLPQPFGEDGSRGVPAQNFNDMNREEIERYDSIEVCDYVVAMEGEKEMEEAMKMRVGGGWVVEFEEIFLDKEESGLERIIRIPWLLDGGIWKGYRAYKWVEGGGD